MPLAPRGQVLVVDAKPQMIEHLEFNMHVRGVDSLKIDIEGFEDAAMVLFLRHADEALMPKQIVIGRESAAGDYPGCVAEFDRLG